MWLPTKKGGLKYKSLFDVPKALFSKLWWSFSTTKTTWSNFMWNKYCNKEIPILVKWRIDSKVWYKMLEAREACEHKFWWEVRKGTSNVWYANWTKLRVLYHLVPTYFYCNEALDDVADSRANGLWHDPILQQWFLEDIA